MPKAGNSVSELTRASLSGAICCCSVVVKKVADSAEPTPHANAAAATQGALACSAIGTSGSVKKNIAAMASTIGRLGFRPRQTRPPTIAPAPCAARIAPHTAAPPRYARPATGPSSIHGAQVIRLKNAHCSVATHNHVRDRNSAHPSPTSPSSPPSPRRPAPRAPPSPASARSARHGGCRPEGAAVPAVAPAPTSRSDEFGAEGRRGKTIRHSTLTAYDAASNAITVAGWPVTATSTPASAGPPILVAEPASPYMAFALARWPADTISTVSACSAGEKNASPLPRTQASSTNSHTGGRPANTATASAACAAQRSASALSMTRRRPSRSPIAPATGSSTTCDTTPASMITPSALALAPVCSTAQAVAIADIAVPSSDVTYPL